MDETVEEVDQYLKDGRPLHLMGVNADKINALNENERGVGEDRKSEV